jgi:sterol desaturase/sphingolipid hydroxylase (fatty acid hydroxylase superfamily)
MEYRIFQPILDTYGAPLIFGVFFLLLYLQFKHPLRRWLQGVRPRLWINVGLAIPSFAVLRLVLIPAEVFTAVWAERNGFGLLNWMEVPLWSKYLLGFLFMDYMLYAWHWMNHVIPFLWRFHNVHHTDLDLGITTAFRFHFVEMFLGAMIRTAGILLVGVPMAMVLVYEVVFQVMVAFQHSNWKLPHAIEKRLVWLVITPRMHGIHHSIVRRETDSNYTNVFSFWDRLHGTIRLNVPQEEVKIGVPAYQDPTDHDLRLKGLYTLPFRKQRKDWKLPDGSEPNREYEGDAGDLKE